MSLRQSDGHARLRMVSKMPSQNHIHRLQDKGERVYQRLRARLEHRYKGQIMAIEVDSGQYVIGKDELQVALRAVKRFPGKPFSFIRIGYPTVHKLRLGVCLKVE